MQITHHATLLRADAVALAVFPMPDESVEVRDQYITRFGIDDARELVRQAHQRPSEASEQTLIVRTDFITLEAQNALLKVLEEPPASTKLVFVVPTGFTILPTLASRFAQESPDHCSSEQPSEVFGDFRSQSYKDRLAAIDQAAKKKDLDWQREIKRGLIQFVAQAKGSSTKLAELEYVARTLLTRGASNKMLLEHAALTLGTRG